jgi:hypothetical protein
MGPAPWWVTLLVGALTVSSSFLAARIRSNRAFEATDQREKAAAREEWFRRVQWATELTLRTDPASRATGLSILASLADSELASRDDLGFIESLNTTNFQLDEVEQSFDDAVDEIGFRADDEDVTVIEPAEERHDDQQ